MRSRIRLDPAVFLPLLVLLLAVPGCRFDTSYMAFAEEGFLEPVECPQEGAAVITRLVNMAARFVPEAGTTDYRLVFSFLPIDPVTTDPTGDPVRHLAAPSGASQGDAGGLAFSFYACVLEGPYEVTAVALRRDIPDSAPRFIADCNGRVTAIGTSVAFSQDPAGGPVTAVPCLAAL